MMVSVALSSSGVLAVVCGEGTSWGCWKRDEPIHEKSSWLVFCGVVCAMYVLTYSSSSSRSASGLDFARS
eukprot:scaffold652_cov260-Pinguiococcus_pyrenoidosus.AAC.9